MARSRRGARLVGAVQLATSGLVIVGVFGALPTRYAPIDGAAVALSAALAVSGAGLVARARWARRVARVVAWGTLLVGLGLTWALTVSASYLAGVYGPVGRGGALILGVVAALALPYLVVAPAVAVRALSGRR